MSIAATVKAMAAAGMSAQQIADVVERMDEERRAKSRAGNAARQARFRARHRNDSNADNGVTCVTPSPLLPSPTPPTNNPLPLSRSSLRSEPTSSAHEAPKGARRGARLPDGWKPADRAHTEEFGQSLSLTPADIGCELDKFRDFWAAQPGAKGVKLDWEATFRNWLRNARPNRSSGKTNGKESLGEYRAKLRRWAEEAEEGEPNGEGIEGGDSVSGGDGPGRVPGAGRRRYSGPFDRGTQTLFGGRLEGRGVYHYSDPEIPDLADRWGGS